MTRFAVIAVVGWLTTAATPASGEWFADVFAGRAFSARQDLDDRSIVGGIPTTQTVERETFEDSVVYGGRLGHWFGVRPYVGLGLDLSHFEANLPGQRRNAVLRPDVFGFSGPIRTTKLELSVTVVSFDVMLRYPFLASKDVPGGRLQPYLTAGPAIFFADLSDRFGNFGGGRQTASDTTVGLKLGTGLAWQFHRHMAVFGEYRFTHASPEFRVRSIDALTTIRITDRFTVDLDTHHVVGGVSFRF